MKKQEKVDLVSSYLNVTNLIALSKREPITPQNKLGKYIEAVKITLLNSSEPDISGVYAEKDKNGENLYTKESMFRIKEKIIRQLCNERYDQRFGEGNFGFCVKILIPAGSVKLSEARKSENQIWKTDEKLMVCCKIVRAAEINPSSSRTARSRVGSIASISRSDSIVSRGFDTEEVRDLADDIKEYSRELQNLIKIMSTMEQDRKSNSSESISRHRNVMKFFGVYYDKYVEGRSDPPLMITEYCNQGSMKDWLRRKAPKRVELTWKRFLDLSKQVASGLMFLETCLIVHRDLSAKNVCIHKSQKNMFTAKIIDFGLGRIVSAQNPTSGYKPIKEDRKLPVRFVPVENLFSFDTPYTFPSDVWSLGITMWEMSIYCCRSSSSSPTIYEYEIEDILNNLPAGSTGYYGGVSPLVRALQKFLAPKAYDELNKGNIIIKESHFNHGPNNRLNIRKDMPEAIKKVIFSTWNVKSKRPKAADIFESLEKIEKCPKSKSFLDNLIPRGNKAEEPNSSSSCSECCIVS